MNLNKKSEPSFEVEKDEIIRKGLSKSIEKQFNQGPLKEQHLMNWLNQILIEYCFGMEFEKGQLKAL